MKIERSSRTTETTETITIKIIKSSPKIFVVSSEDDSGNIGVVVVVGVAVVVVVGVAVVVVVGVAVVVVVGVAVVVGQSP